MVSFLRAGAGSFHLSGLTQGTDFSQSLLPLYFTRMMGKLNKRRDRKRKAQYLEPSKSLIHTSYYDYYFINFCHYLYP